MAIFGLPLVQGHCTTSLKTRGTAVFSPCPKVIKDHPVCPVIEGNILQLESEKRQLQCSSDRQKQLRKI